MQIHYILMALAAFGTSQILPAEGQFEATAARPLDPDSPDIIGQFYQVGLPKYTDIEKRIIERAQKLQDEHTAIFNKIAIGNTVFDYPRLIALGVIRYDQQGQIPYTLTFGIRPHITEFAGSFGEYLIQFDAKGIVQSKSKVPNAFVTKNAEAAPSNR
ncbi:MAG: hypothetical protein V4727_06080 [Verrucomicrobiota bacterium]